MSQQKNPREFWIDFKIGGHEASQQTTEVSLHKLSYPYKNIIHVIEFSAYQHLQSELEALKKDHATVLKYGVEGQREINRKLTVELTAEREASKRLAEALKKTQYEADVAKKGLANIGIGNVALNEAISVIQEALSEYKKARGEG